MQRFEKEIPFPKVIYKYTRIDQFLYNHLINKELWFSSSQDFNDPYDCNICFDTKVYSQEEIRTFWESNYHNPKPSREEIEKKVTEWVEDQTLLEKYLYPGLRKHLQTVGITCFTSKNNNLLMWSHYANSHRGLCIGYDSKALTKDFYQYEWVSYQDKFPKVNLLDINNFMARISVTKSKEWEYEDEIRFFQKERLSYPFKQESIKEIIFGLRTPISQMKTVMNLAHQLDYKGITFKQVILRDNQFAAEFATLNYSPKHDRIFVIHQANGKLHFKVLKGWLETG